MLPLRRVAALRIAKGWIGIDNAFVTQVLQCHQILGLIQPIKPTTAKRQRSKILVDDVQQLLRLC